MSGRILVVDDEAQIRKFLRIALEASGFTEVSWRRPAGPVFGEFVARKPA